MRRRASLSALAIVATVNVAMVAGVWRNRSGPPDADLWLDERELELLPAQRENSELALRWRVQREAPPGARYAAVAAPWLDGPKLEALGFDCPVPPGAPEAVTFYRRQLSRQVLVVLELGGPDFEGRLAAWQARARDDLASWGRPRDDADREAVGSVIEAAPRRASRLVAVDAGLDLAPLRARYADRGRYPILPGIVRLVHLTEPRDGGPALAGRLVALLPAEIFVPRHARAVFSGLAGHPPGDRPASLLYSDLLAGLAATDHAPRYRVRIAIGGGLQARVVEAAREP